jgi:hypothetical protein
MQKKHVHIPPIEYIPTQNANKTNYTNKKDACINVPSEFSLHTNPNKTQIPPLGWSFVFCETQKNLSRDRTVSQDRIAYDRTIKLAISCPFVVRIGKHSRKPPQKVSIKVIYVMHLNQVDLLGLGLICLITYYSAIHPLS